MNPIQFVLFAAILTMPVVNFADEQLEREEAKQAAQEACLTQAQQRYGAAKIVSGPRKEKINRLSGYSLKIRVGRFNKEVKCLATRNGETKFYIG